MTDEIEVLSGEVEITPERGDIVAHVKSGVEYVFYAIVEKTVQDEKVVYPTWLMQERTGKLGGPYIVLGGFDHMQFIERGAPREPGERPVRPLVMPVDPDVSTITGQVNV